MAKAKNISVFLMDGIPSGKIKAKISNFDGIAYKIPRECLAECKGFDAFQQSGVYFLFGYNNVYVGQAEVRKSGKGIHQRILDHETDKLKDAWEEVVIFTRKDGSFGKTDISFLENKFYNMAVETGRYNVLNGNEPSMGTVTEEKECELLEYIEEAELILGALGYKVFEKPIYAYEKSIETPVSKNDAVPPLPEGDMKIGAYIKAAMQNLSDSGYVFTDEAIEEMCTKEWSHEHMGLHYPFMRLCSSDDKADNTDDKGYTRFWTTQFTFGDKLVLISKEWFDKSTSHYSEQDRKFIEWYKSL